MKAKLSYDDVSDLCAWLLEAEAPTLMVQKGLDNYTRVIFLDAKLKTTETIYWSFKDEQTAPQN